MSYMVMECHSSYAILLDDEGRFLKAANLQYKVGQTVSDPVLMREETPKVRHIERLVTSSVAAIAACFLLIFGIGYYQDYIEPYSSIYLSINPAVRMVLNRNGTVVSLIGTNEDGVILLDGYDGKRKDKITVADELIDRAIEMGFLSEGGQVSFSIDAPEDALFQEYGVDLRSRVTEHLDGRITIAIEILDHRAEQENSAPTSSPKPESSSRPDRPVVAPPITSNGDTDYSDTDYGSNNEDVSDYTPPTSRPPESSNGKHDWNSEYTDGNTDYDPQNVSEEEDDDDGRDDTDDDDNRVGDEDSDSDDSRDDNGNNYDDDDDETVDDD